MNNFIKAITLLAMCAIISGCGQRGPLYLPSPIGQSKEQSKPYPSRDNQNPALDPDEKN
ncbi:LPS translocon maturation chaperone LptM [Ampullimonas aquatilis]|uniref:LPS translocon maturation chaperone LptM n=1 Tax=Ampullimonas aquatilis TaxID=1341549 RepID=UPI003C77B44B